MFIDYVDEEFYVNVVAKRRKLDKKLNDLVEYSAASLSRCVTWQHSINIISLRFQKMMLLFYHSFNSFNIIENSDASRKCSVKFGSPLFHVWSRVEQKRMFSMWDPSICQNNLANVDWTELICIECLVLWIDLNKLLSFPWSSRSTMSRISFEFVREST